MSDLLVEICDQVCLLTLNRVDKHNAFDDQLLRALHDALILAEQNAKISVVILKANGKHFSAGADLAWMQRMIQFNEQENLADSLVLAQVMYALHHSSKPTIAMIQGSAFGGGAGFAAACTFAIAADNARFCFSEVKLGLIPAVISPYVVRAIGARAAQMLFVSAEIFTAERALALNLIQHCVSLSDLEQYTLNYAQQICQNAPEAVRMSLNLVRHVAAHELNETLIHYTAALIAQKRTSAEGQRGLTAFLNKQPPKWS